MRALALCCLTLLFVIARAEATSQAPETDHGEPGALVRTTSEGTVGVLLDEIPSSMRARVAAALAAKPPAFWRERATQQLRLTNYRLVFREFFYVRPRKQLPLPPESLWRISLLGKPERRTIQGHDVMAVDYRFSSTLMTDAASPAISEPGSDRSAAPGANPSSFPWIPSWCCSGPAMPV